MDGQNRKKENLIAIITFIIAFFVVFCVITRGKFLYGSSIDWESQHYLIPEYFRTLFYETKNLFPDFAFHLGGGQNIYYFSYYGFLSPLILISYFLPFIPMVNYIQFLGIILPLFSIILFYFYLRRHQSFSCSFFCSLLFLFAGPIIFHSHRHLMFMNYMPFFMMALFGIDQFFSKNKLSLLTLSCFLIVMTSYYYSVGAFVSLFCYGIYYGMKHKKWTRKKIFIFFLPFIISILMSSILLLPTLYTLLSGRGVKTTLSFLSLLIPKRDFTFFLYRSYSIGLTMISLIATLYLLFTKKRENIFLGSIIILISIFPIFNYILNGTLYVDSKSLIPFLPIILIFTSEFFQLLFEHQISYKKLFFLFGITFLFTTSKWSYLDLGILMVLFFIYWKTKKKMVIFLPLSILSFMICIGTNLADSLLEKNKIYNETYQQMNEAIERIIEHEDNLYRINNAFSKSITMNKIMDPHQLTTTLYSSTFNSNYNTFFYDTSNNAIPYRNRSMTSSSSNPLFQAFMGEKYYLTTDKAPFHAKIIDEYGALKVYELDTVLPIGYATSKLISKNEYDGLTYPSNMLTLLSGIVVDEGKNGVVKKEKEIPCIELVDQKNITYQKEKYGYEVIAKRDASLTLKLDDKIKDDIIFIRFKNNYNPPCGKDELSVTINGVKNKLSCTSWKYHNQNFIFDYVLYDTDILDISFVKGKYQLSDFEFYRISKEEFLSLLGERDEFIFDQKNTLGDTIRGTIQVKEDGFFMFSIPYDRGFHAFVDGKEVTIKKVNEAFLGFKIKKGNHTIQLTYEAPYKKTGLYFSLLGFILWIGIILYEKRH